MVGISGDFAGRERCRILGAIEQDLQGLDSLSDDQKETLEWAIDLLMRLYGCRF